MLSLITAPVIIPLLTIRSRRASLSFSSSSKIPLNTLGWSESASFRKRLKTSTLGGAISSGKFEEGQGILMRIISEIGPVMGLKDVFLPQNGAENGLIG